MKDDLIERGEDGTSGGSLVASRRSVGGKMINAEALSVSHEAKFINLKVFLQILLAQRRPIEL